METRRKQKHHTAHGAFALLVNAMKKDNPRLFVYVTAVGIAGVLVALAGLFDLIATSERGLIAGVVALTLLFRTSKRFLLNISGDPNFHVTFTSVMGYAVIPLGGAAVAGFVVYVGELFGLLVARRATDANIRRRHVFFNPGAQAISIFLAGIVYYATNTIMGSWGVYDPIVQLVAWPVATAVGNQVNIWLVIAAIWFQRGVFPKQSVLASRETILIEMGTNALVGALFWQALVNMGLLALPLFAFPVFSSAYAYNLIVEEKKKLEIIVEERTKDLQNSLERERITLRQLMETDRLKTEFLASMSHELRTPLNAIIGFADMLLFTLETSRDDDLEAELADDLQDSATRILRNGRHLLLLINNLLDMTKVEAGEMQELELRGAHPAAIIAATTGLFQGMLYTWDGEFEEEVQEGLPPVCVDELRIKQVLLNLLSNALKFSDKHIMIRAWAGNDRVFISVTNDGIGIPADELPFIWDRFKQTRGTSGGTGLGLAISRELVERMGGTITAVSPPGQWTTFTVSLPYDSNQLSATETGRF